MRSSFQLIGAAALQVEISQDCASSRPLLLEAHFSSADHPLDPGREQLGHLPDAIQIHPSYLEAGLHEEKYYPFYDCPEDGNLLPQEELVISLQRLGIRPDSEVVVYGADLDGTMAAARVVWGLLHAGVKTVRLLDGGLAEWIRFGGETAPSIRKATHPDASQNRVPMPEADWVPRPEILAKLEQVKAISAAHESPLGKLIDVRDRGEWDGSDPNHYSFYSAGGHIPNASFQGEWERLLEPGTGKIGPRLEETAQHWRSLGILDARVEAGECELIFYCGTGWRSSVSFLVALLLGLRTRNFDDGFYGWTWAMGNRVAYDSAPCGKAVDPTQATKCLVDESISRAWIARGRSGFFLLRRRLMGPISFRNFMRTIGLNS